MKFTDRFFEMPVRIYDEMSVIKQLQQELSPEDDQPKVEGTTFMELLIKIPANCLYDITWRETYLWKDMETAIKREDKKEGWGKNATDVYIPTLQERYLCTLPKKEFEDLINNFMETIPNDQAINTN